LGELGARGTRSRPFYCLDMPNPAAHETLTAVEFAHRIGVHRLTVASMVKRGEVRVVRVGLRDRIPASELDRLLATARTSPVQS